MAPRNSRTSPQDGWKSGIIRGAIVAGVVFIINLALAVWSSVKSTHLADGRRVLYQGSCSQVKQLDTGVHLLINLLSTLLLGACNYAMQCLSAPTRQEVDDAHEKRIWLDIGVLSFRNLTRIDSRRRTLWICFAFSSLPFHLFYNSSVYASVYTADYLIVMTTEDMLANNAPSRSLGIDANDPLNQNHTIPGSLEVYGDFLYLSNDTLGRLSSNLYNSAIANNLTRLTASECINNYASAFPTKQGNVILVTNNATQTPYVSAYDTITPLNDVYGGCPARAFDWICNQNMKPGGCTSNPPCSKMRAAIDPDDWRPYGNRIEYCLSQELEEKCNLAINEPIIGVVLAFNLLKCVLLIFTIYRLKAISHTLLTVGDSISSFLQRQDETTKGLCLMSRDDLTGWTNCSQGTVPKPKTLVASKMRWNSAVGGPRWVCLSLLFSILLLICTILFIYGIQPRAATTSALMSLPLGATDPRTMIQGNAWHVPALGVRALLANVFISNSPQLILSMIYFAYNGLFTSFLLGAEWNSFARQRKGLRVSSDPAGEQRGTHFLQLPYRWAIPLMTFSVILHWLCSQSLFLVSTEFDHSLFLDAGADAYCDSPDANIQQTWGLCLVQYFTCGYSPVAILSTIGLGVFMILFAVLIGRREYRNSGIPVAGSCSAAISAACHLGDQGGNEGDMDNGMEQNEIGHSASRSSLQWGELDVARSLNANQEKVNFVSRDVEASERRVYHCGFSHMDVKVPEEGRFYAG